MQDVALTDARRLHTRSGHTRRFSSCATCKEDRSHGVSHVPLGMPRSQGPMCAACVLSPSLQPASRTPSREPPTRACRRLRHISYAHPPPPWGPWGGCTRSRCAGRRRRPQVRLDCRRSRSRVDTQTGGPWPNFDLNEYDYSPRPTPRTRDGLQNTQTGSRSGQQTVPTSPGGSCLVHGSRRVRLSRLLGPAQEPRVRLSRVLGDRGAVPAVLGSQARRTSNAGDCAGSRVRLGRGSTPQREALRGRRPTPCARFCVVGKGAAIPTAPAMSWDKFQGL